MIAGLLPCLTAAVTIAIQAMVNTVVVQAAAKVMDKVGEAVQREALIQCYETVLSSMAEDGQCV